MFHVLKNGIKSWTGETFEDAAKAVREIAASPDADLIELRFGSNAWMHFYKYHDAKGWRRVLANRGQENLAAHGLTI